jgi:D-glycero-alpha-D-manno-heptose-7-phosphate kinase
VDQIFHPTIREAMRMANVEDSLELTNMSDVHAHGTGLGSSSSFVAGMLNALYTYHGTKADAEKLARDTCKIEIDILKDPVGKQDQYIAAYGGFSFIKFNPDETVSVEQVKASSETVRKLESNLLFFYTGLTRRSGQILKGQKQNINAKRAMLDQMRGITEKVRRELEAGKLDSFGKSLHESWELKRSLADGISNEMIDKYYHDALDAGAEGGKVLGAGGGGFLMFYCKPDAQTAVRKALAGLREVKFGFSPKGSEIIYNDEKEKSW